MKSEKLIRELTMTGEKRTPASLSKLLVVNPLLLLPWPRYLNQVFHKWGDYALRLCYCECDIYTDTALIFANKQIHCVCSFVPQEDYPPNVCVRPLFRNTVQCIHAPSSLCYLAPNGKKNTALPQISNSELKWSLFMRCRRISFVVKKIIKFSSSSQSHGPFHFFFFFLKAANISHASPCKVCCDPGK